MSCGQSTHKIFYTQTLLHMVLLHKHTLTHRRFDTQKPLHTNAFTHRRFYTQIRFTHARFYTQTLLHTAFTHAFTHRRFYTQIRFTHAHTLSHTNAFTHTRFQTQTLLYTDAFTHRHLYRNEIVHRNFSSVFDVQRPFRAKGLRLTSKIAIFPQFLTSNVHFVRKGCD